MSPTPVNKQPAVERSSSVAPQSVTPTSAAPVSAPVSVAAPTQPQQPAISEAQAFEVIELMLMSKSYTYCDL